MTTPFSVSRIGVEVNLPDTATYDLLLVATPQGYPAGRVLFQFENVPRKITGIQKVAQLFLKILFTTQGSDVVYANTGTQFPNLIVGANRQQDDATYRAELISAINSAESQVKYILNDSTTDMASQLDSVTIQGFEFTKESLSMYLKIMTLAGETASISIPFPELDMSLANG